MRQAVPPLSRARRIIQPITRHRFCLSWIFSLLLSSTMQAGARSAMAAGAIKSRYDSSVSLRQHCMAHMVFSPALRRRKDTANTQSDLSSSRWHKLTCGGNHHASIAQPLKLGIDILGPVGRNFISRLQFCRRTIKLFPEIGVSPLFRRCEGSGFWCNFSSEDRPSLFQLLLMRQSLPPIPAGPWPPRR
jgi:hypothetical protein